MEQIESDAMIEENAWAKEYFESMSYITRNYSSAQIALALYLPEDLEFAQGDHNIVSTWVLDGIENTWWYVKGCPE
jgi:hypothetical protein